MNPVPVVPFGSNLPWSDSSGMPGRSAYAVTVVQKDLTPRSRLMGRHLPEPLVGLLPIDHD